MPIIPLSFQRHGAGKCHCSGLAAPVSDNSADMMSAERKKGFFVSFDYSQDALIECDQFFRRAGRVIVPLTVRGILEKRISHKLALTVSASLLAGRSL